MTYRGVSGNNKKLGIKPTDEDRAFVHTLARMKLGVRRIGVLMGERYGLGKPMSRMSLYYHYKNELKKQGQQKTKLSRAMVAKLLDDIGRVVDVEKKKP